MPENKTPPRRPNYVFILIACAFLVYLGVKIALQVKNGDIAENTWLFILAAVVFIAFGLIFGIRNFKYMMDARQADREETARAYAEEEAAKKEQAEALPEDEAPYEDAEDGDEDTDGGEEN